VVKAVNGVTCTQTLAQSGGTGDQGGRPCSIAPENLPTEGPRAEGQSDVGRASMGTVLPDAAVKTAVNGEEIIGPPQRLTPQRTPSTLAPWRDKAGVRPQGR
jgi:hypothetical protein